MPGVYIHHSCSPVHPFFCPCTCCFLYCLPQEKNLTNGCMTGWLTAGRLPLLPRSPVHSLTQAGKPGEGVMRPSGQGVHTTWPGRPPVEVLLMGQAMHWLCSTSCPGQGLVGVSTGSINP
jgi:hypothetical protein